MTNTSLLAWTLFVGTALGLSACGPIVPVNPTWKDDVRPLVVARCMRCHDNPVHVDLTGKMPTSSFNYPESGVLSPFPPELVLLQSLGPRLVRGPVAAFRRMPPSPAAALQDWQIEILEAWAALPR